MLSPITLSFLTVSIIPSVTEPSIERVAMPVRSLNRNVACIADLRNDQSIALSRSCKRGIHPYEIMQLFIQTFTKVKRASTFTSCSRRVEYCLHKCLQC